MAHSAFQGPNRLPTCLAIILALALPFLRPGALERSELEHGDLSERTTLLARDYESLRYELSETQKTLNRMESALADNSF